MNNNKRVTLFISFEEVLPPTDLAETIKDKKDFSMKVKTTICEKKYETETVFRRIKASLVDGYDTVFIVRYGGSPVLFKNLEEGEKTALAHIGRKVLRVIHRELKKIIRQEVLATPALEVKPPESRINWCIPQDEE
jgi:hypothetical protein